MTSDSNEGIKEDAAEHDNASETCSLTNTKNKPVQVSQNQNTSRGQESNIDNTHQITYGHKIANYLQKYKFYFPAKDQAPIEIEVPATSSKAEIEANGAPKMVQPPSLNKAWEFFENQCLPRRFANFQSHTKGRKYLRAGNGVLQPTKLYPVFNTPIGDMADFGIGVGMYFKTLRYFGIVTFIAGCISIPSMMFLSSEEYSTPNDDTYTTETDFFTYWYDKLDSFSAVCYDTKFQPCPSCKEDDWTSFSNVNNRLFYGDDGLIFVLINDCRLNETFAIFTMATMMFVLVAVYLFAYFQRRDRIRLDIGEQTSKDYSIKIHVSGVHFCGLYYFITLFLFYILSNMHLNVRVESTRYRNCQRS